MRPVRRWIPVVALVPTLMASACICGAEDQLSVSTFAPDPVTVTRDGATRKIETIGQLTSPPIEASRFQFVYNTLEGSSSGKGLALTFSGRDPVTDDIVILTIAVPVALRSGTEYPVGETFTIEPTVDGDPRGIGSYELQRTDQAAAAFSVSTYVFPPPQFNIGFRAVATTGSILVVQREKGGVQLRLNLTFTDATGKTAVVTGRVQATAHRSSRPCD
jgi:hypothetical protein